MTASMEMGKKLILEGHKSALKDISNGLSFRLGDWYMEVCVLFYDYFNIHILPCALACVCSMVSDSLRPF